MKIEDSSIIYYRDKNGAVQDGENWVCDIKHGAINEDEELIEVYWSSMSQRWIDEETTNIED